MARAFVQAGTGGGGSGGGLTAADVRALDNDFTVYRDNATLGVAPTGTEAPSPTDGNVATVHLSDGQAEVWARESGAWVRKSVLEGPAPIEVIEVADVGALAPPTEASPKLIVSQHNDGIYSRREPSPGNFVYVQVGDAGTATLAPYLDAGTITCTDPQANELLTFFLSTPQELSDLRITAATDVGTVDATLQVNGAPLGSALAVSATQATSPTQAGPFAAGSSVSVALANVAGTPGVVRVQLLAMVNP